ncbi:MAG: GHKL domain-containing protein [Deltaproteobacteria bacterium]|nr:GHKL domain-containing protein [Deltaproteobacteria bacterium]
MRILFANQTFKNDFGDRVGEHCYEVYKESSVKCPTCPLEQTFKGKKVYINEQTFQLPQKKICQALVHSAPIFDDNGNIIAAVELAINVTDLKQVLKELTFLGQSIAFLSHGIKNILEGLQGGAYVVDEGINGKDMALAIKGWNIVKKNIFDITDVVQNILYASKNRPLNYKKVSPVEIVNGSVELFREKAVHMGIDLQIEAAPDLPLVNIDTFATRRMLNNLIWNALEACIKDNKEGSHIVVVRTGLYDKSHFHFEVEDNGIGMDEITKGNIFEEFFSTKGSSGTGLGLAVVEKIVNKHGGVIEVETGPGKGTLFRIILKI